MRAPRTRDAWFFVRPAGTEVCALVGSCWRVAEGWTVWVREVHDYGRPTYVVRARMWGQRTTIAWGVTVWEGPHFEITVSRSTHASLHAAREYACGLVFVLAGAMSVEGLAHRCPRGRYYRDGREGDIMALPWRWLREPWHTRCM